MSEFVSGFFVGLGHRKWAKVASIIFACFMFIVAFGWIVPLAVGIYRLVTKH